MKTEGNLNKSYRHQLTLVKRPRSWYGGIAKGKQVTGSSIWLYFSTIQLIIIHRNIILKALFVTASRKETNSERQIVALSSLNEPDSILKQVIYQETTFTKLSYYLTYYDCYLTSIVKFNFTR